jgi:hypothetical protein
MDKITLQEEQELDKVCCTTESTLPSSYVCITREQSNKARRNLLEKGTENIKECAPQQNKS